MGTRSMLEEQVKGQIQQKREALIKAEAANDDKRSLQLKDDLTKLEELFEQIKNQKTADFAEAGTYK